MVGVFTVKKTYNNSTEMPFFNARCGYFPALKTCFAFFYIQIFWEAVSADGDVTTLLHMKAKHLTDEGYVGTVFLVLIRLASVGRQCL